jgi:primosomal protein N''
LYGQLEAFDEPVPSDAPFEYEVEELEAWEKLRAQIRALEHALAEISRRSNPTAPTAAVTLPGRNTAVHRYCSASSLKLTKPSTGK